MILRPRPSRSLGLPAVAALVLAGSLPPSRVVAAPGAAVTGLQAWLDGTRTLDCRFEQRFVSEALGAALEESGRLRIERPGRMRWDYDEPDSKVALVRDERTFLYLADDRQYLVGKLSEDERILPELMAGRGRIEELFEVAPEEADGRGRLRLRLRPRRPAGGVAEVRLVLDARDFAILGASIVDPSGSRTEYAFRRVRRNASFPPRVFDFTPPPGTEIVESP